MELEIIEYQQGDISFFSDFISFRNSLYKDEDSFVKEGLSEFKLFLDHSSDFNRDYEWRAILFQLDSKIVARTIICLRKSSKKIINLGYFEIIEDIEIFRNVYGEIEKLIQTFQAKQIKWPINGNFFHSYRIKADDTSSNLAPCYILKGYYRDFFEASGYSKARIWNNYKVSYAGYKSNAESAISYVKKKYSHFDDIEVRPLDKKHFKQDMKLFYNLLSKSFEDKAEFESVSFRDFYRFYEDFKSILDPRLINFSTYKSKDLGFMICYSDYVPALQLKNRLDEKWYVPSIVSSLLALWKIKQKPDKIFLSFLGKDESGQEHEIKGLTIKHHEVF